MAKDYYAILGVKKDASADELKKAFRRLAHEHHPDKGGDAAKFKDINEAYQILGDEKKRAAYDRFGSAAFEQGGAGGGPGFDPSGFDFSGFQNGGFNMGDFGDLGDVLGEMFGFSRSQEASQCSSRARRRRAWRRSTTRTGSSATFGAPFGGRPTRWPNTRTGRSTSPT
jgi:molecular chaperone DnaJ